MARLIKCSDCRKKVSTRAETCPHCGAPVTVPENSKRQYSLAGLLHGVLLIACVIVGIGAFQEHLLFSVFSFVVAIVLLKQVRTAIAGKTKAPKVVAPLLYVLLAGTWVYGLTLISGDRDDSWKSDVVVRQDRAETTPRTENESRPRDMWVTSDRLERHTCPDMKCGAVGALFFREKATVLEKSNGWGRITRYYDGSCVGGKSEYVDSGNSQCEAANGFKDGKFAEWVPLAQLATKRPPDPAAGATGAHELVAGSDDYKTYKDVFAKTATDLIAERRCSAKDFKDNGGWIKSMTHKDKPVYFTYCDGYTKVYLDAATGKVIN